MDKTTALKLEDGNKSTEIHLWRATNRFQLVGQLDELEALLEGDEENSGQLLRVLRGMGFEIV